MIIDDELPGEINTKELIEQIKNKNDRIKVILITKENDDGIKVYKKVRDFNILELISIINEGTPYINQFISLETKQEKERDGKIITVLGPNGIGKSIFSVTFAQSIKNKKVLIIDFDMLNNNIHLLLGIKNYSKKIKQIEKNKTLRAEGQKNRKKLNNIVEFDFQKNNKQTIDIEKYVIPTKYNVDLISGTNIITYLYERYEKLDTLKNIVDLKKQYDIIIVDTSNNYILENTKEVIEISDKLIFISGANVLEVKKSKELLKLYEKEWDVDKEKINIIFNKYTKQSIESEILKNIFREYHILGKLNLSEYYDKAININNIKIKEIQKELNKIRESIEKEKRKVNGIK